MDAVCAAPRRNLLGEGPIWDRASRRLWWVDIKGRALEWLEPHSGASGTFPLDRMASAVALWKNGLLLLATEHGVATFDPAEGRLEHRLELEPDRPWNRSNESRVDPRGRFWIGTMDDAIEQSSGSIWRLDPDWSVRRVLDGFWIPNTMTFTPDGRTLYLADTRKQAIFVFDVEPETGELGEPRVFASTEGTDANPDGSALDSQGYLWNAQWGAWRIVRYAPDGSIDRMVPLPVEQPSSCAFGGDDLSTLFITTAREDLSEEQLAAQPLAGSLLAVRPGVRGLEPHPFAG